MKLYAWKFMVPSLEPVLGDDGFEYQGFNCTVLAETSEQARKALLEYAEREGLPRGWISVTVPERRDVAVGVLSWVEF